MSLELFDTHVHLCDERFAEDRDAVIARAHASGVGRMVEIADAPSEWENCIALCRARPALRCSLGLHPYYADQFAEELLASLQKKIALPEVVAVGELGLDYVKTDIARDVQIRALERLLSAAKDWDIPVVVHCRGAYLDLIPVLKNIFPSPPAKHRFWGVVHCFSGTLEEAVACAGLGFALGADGPVTYPKNDPLRAAFREVGPAVTVLETDSPWLPPQSARGKRNEPAAIPEIAERLAGVWGIALEETARATTANAASLYRL